jgi:mono/diheme cytochrome c family protein
MLAATAAVAQAPDDAPTFADVANIVNDRCVKCHSGVGAPEGLELDSLAGLKSGSWNGRVAEPGNPEASELIRRIKGISQPRMPFDGPPFLDDAEIALIERWVAAGMPAGDEPPPEAEARSIPAPGEPVRFADVEPVLTQRCIKCHSDASVLGAPPEGLRLASRDAVLAGGDRMVVVPGNPGASELVRRIRGQSLPRMPFDGPPFLDDDEIRLIVDWIAQGAPDDDGTAAPVPAGARLRLEGTLTARWALDDTPLTVTGDSRIDDGPRIGDRVEVRGVVGEDGSVVVIRLRAR